MIEIYGVLVKADTSIVCIYNQCHKCEEKCLRKVMFYLKRLRIEPYAVDECHSTVLKYTRPAEAYQAMMAIETVCKIRGKLIFPI